jgi:hypothetical protein
MEASIKKALQDLNLEGLLVTLLDRYLNRISHPQRCPSLWFL